MIFLVVNAWILGCIANALEQRRFTSVCPPDDKDAEVGVFRPKFRGFSKTFELVLDPGEHEWGRYAGLRGKGKSKTLMASYINQGATEHSCSYPRRADLG